MLLIAKLEKTKPFKIKVQDTGHQTTRFGACLSDSITAKKYHDQCNSSKRKQLTGPYFQFQRINPFSVIGKHGSAQVDVMLEKWQALYPVSRQQEERETPGQSTFPVTSVSPPTRPHLFLIPVK